MTRPFPARVIVTGAAGFIGFHVARELLRRGAHVIGIDALRGTGEDRFLRGARLAEIAGEREFEPKLFDLHDRAQLDMVLQANPGVPIVHLAAQPGVRRPGREDYLRDNVEAFFTLVEACRKHRVPHLLFASSSSVYGSGSKPPFSLDARIDRPKSTYAATKAFAELLAHAAATESGLPCTAMRFFTVYGPWGRPDMTPYLFTRALLERKPIPLFGHGRTWRDFTFVDDVVACIVRLLDRPPSSTPPFATYNIGAGRPVEMRVFLKQLENLVGRAAIVDLQPAIASEMDATWADSSAIERDIGFAAWTPLEAGLPKLVAWMKERFRAD